MSRIKAFQDVNSTLQISGKSNSKEVSLLQNVLSRFGYLNDKGIEIGHFCECTQSAIRRFQRFHGLKVDGKAGKNTKSALMQPRCGLPDEISESASFVLRGCQYHTTQLTYAFENDSQDLPAEQSRQIVRDAFLEWERVSPLRFTQVLPSGNPTFRIAWRFGDHGDGDPFDGVGNVIAHAFFPPPCGGTFAGSLHFDESEKFSSTANAGIHLGAVALHEIGHLLGLGHSRNRKAIMFPTYAASRLSLEKDDVEGIQQLYGAPRLRFSTKATDKLSKTSDEKFFVVELPKGANMTLEGPGNSDFDLYVKRDSVPSKDNFDFRAWTLSSNETLRVNSETPGIYHILVQSYEGSGEFTLRIELD